jgi:agmatinase
MDRFAIIPCPHEATTSYGHGTKRGPAAILKAAEQVELFDEELGRETVKPGWYKAEKAVKVASLESRVTSLDKIPIVLGGEHSITPQVVKALTKKHKDLSVLQLDAHADLRDSYRGSKNSHACAMRRVLEICPAVQVGIRSISAEEWEWAKNNGQLNKIHFAEKIEETAKIEMQLSKNVYLTIDVDVFDPSVIPATGTPEPGGLFWYEILDILRGVCLTKNIVGLDLVELAPRPGDHASDFTIAKLLYKLIGYISR